MKALKKTSQPRRAIPSVDAVVRALEAVDLPRKVVVDAVRKELAAVRAAETTPIDEADVLTAVAARLDVLRLGRIQPVINATGIIIHTNLARSPMGSKVSAAIASAAANYTNLEFDLAGGQRGRRGGYLENALAILCRAQAATVVNNCAAALVLALRHFAPRPPRNQVIISRGELIQIGGGFRIPEILQASGASLREVGTTNKTTANDYRRAMDDQTALILKVHHSSFYMGGFVESPSTADLSLIAREHAIPLMQDIGSGATFDTRSLGPEHEPTPSDVIAAGADIVCFSGDKLLGGPQAGIIAGSQQYISALKGDPFFRALRCDKLILTALETTVDLLLSDEADDIPIRAMMRVSIADLTTRAHRIADKLAEANPGAAIDVCPSEARIGGGTLPRTTLPSIAIRVQSRQCAPARLAELLRRSALPVIGHIENDAVMLDLRTVFPDQDDLLHTAVTGALAAGAKHG